MTLTEFLLARFAEDEADASDVHDVDCRLISWGASEGWCDCARPSRVIAECEAKRTLVEELSRMERDEMGWDGIERKVMGYLAMPYADHPDYREEWKL